MAYSPENNPYVPGDPYSYDLKWMVDKFKNFEEPEKYAQAAAASAEETAASAELAEQSKSNAILAQRAAEAAAESASESETNISTAVNSAVDPLASDVAVLSARVDNFEQLSEGSTTGDAELIDARIGADGYTWSTAGNAIREQVGQLKTRDEYLSESIAKITGRKYILFTPGAWHIYAEGSTADATPMIDSANYGAYVCAKVPITEGEQIVITGRGGAGITRMFCYLNTAGEVILRSGVNYVYTKHVLTAPANSAYILINLYSNYDYSVYKIVTADSIVNLAGTLTADAVYTIPYDQNDSIQLFESVASYEQSGTLEIPTIRFMIGSGLNGSTEFPIGALNDPIPQQWRMGRYPGDETKITINITVPAGVTLHITKFTNSYYGFVNNYQNGLKINGHRRIPFCPWDSYASAVMASMLGKRAFVEIPKRLSDGVWICYHDNTLIYNDTYIRQADGSQLPSTYNGTSWDQISYSTASTWDWGISKNERFAGTKPFKVEDFFIICAKTGMKPILSLHPFPNASELEELYNMAKKCGVLKNLTLKCSTSNEISNLFAVFGNDIEKYIYNIPSGTQSASAINNAVSKLDALAGCTAERGIEVFSSTAFDAYFGNSRYNLFELITGAGYIASLCHQNGAYSPYDNGAATHNMLLGYDFIYWNKNHGVTEFTDEYNWNDGLNW